ncbi:hypothetical protein QQ045_030180 [Rhodiola kirilowii]
MPAHYAFVALYHLLGAALKCLVRSVGGSLILQLTRLALDIRGGLSLPYIRRFQTLTMTRTSSLKNCTHAWLLSGRRVEVSSSKIDLENSPVFERFYFSF